MCEPDCVVSTLSFVCFQYQQRAVKLARVKTLLRLMEGPLLLGVPDLLVFHGPEQSERLTL